MEKIRVKYQNANIELKLGSEIHTQHTKGSTYKNIHGIIKNGIKICMSDKKHTFLDIPKLIINGIGSYNYVFYDKKGEYGMSEKSIGIINPSSNTLQFIQSPLFHYIANSTKNIGNNFNIKTSLFLPIIPENIKIKDVNDLYNYFEFSPDEIAKINIFSIPTYKYQQLSCDGKTLLNGTPIHNIKDQIVKELEEDEDEDNEENDNEVQSKKSPINLDEKIVLVPATEAEEVPSIQPQSMTFPVIKIGKKKNLRKEPSIASGATKLLPPPAKEVLEKTGGKTKKKGSKTKKKTFKKSTKKIKRIRYKKTTIRKK